MVIVPNFLHVLWVGRIALLGRHSQSTLGLPFLTQEDRSRFLRGSTTAIVRGLHLTFLLIWPAPHARPHHLIAVLISPISRLGNNWGEGHWDSTSHSSPWCSTVCHRVATPQRNSRPSKSFLIAGVDSSQLENIAAFRVADPTLSFQTCFKHLVLKLRSWPVPLILQ